jgi:predicted dehydrogenase
MNQGIHYVDLLLWAMGPAAEVTALTATQAHEVEVEDVALALLRFCSGAVGTIVASTAVFPGFAQRLEITGTNGTVVIEDGQIVRRDISGEESRSAAPGGAADHGGCEAAANPAGLTPASHAAQIADLLGAIDAGRQPSVTAESGRAALEVVCAVYQSAREGRKIMLPAAAGGARGVAGMQ